MPEQQADHGDVYYDVHRHCVEFCCFGRESHAIACWCLDCRLWPYRLGVPPSELPEPLRNPAWLKAILDHHAFDPPAETAEALIRAVLAELKNPESEIWKLKPKNAGG